MTLQEQFRIGFERGFENALKAGEGAGTAGALLGLGASEKGLTSSSTKIPIFILALHCLSADKTLPSAQIRNLTSCLKTV